MEHKPDEACDLVAWLWGELLPQIAELKLVQVPGLRLTSILQG